jgi:hypothetical protein
MSKTPGWYILGPFAYLLVLTLVFCAVFLTVGDDLSQGLFPYVTRFQVVLWQFILLGSFLTVSLSDPGTITIENRSAALERYHVYDGVLYDRKDQCQTCRLGRVPRASHSKSTGRCVECHDHYCIWVNNDVGRRNRGLFILFLLLHACGLAHGVTICGSAFLQKLCHCYKPASENVLCARVPVQQILDCTISDECFCVLLLTALLFLFVYMLGFQLLLASRNMTTKEYYKWKAVRLAWQEYASGKVKFPPPSDMPRSGVSPGCDSAPGLERKDVADDTYSLPGKHISNMQPSEAELQWNPPPANLSVPARCEHIRGALDEPALEFPYDRGSFWRNLIETLRGSQ